MLIYNSSVKKLLKSHENLFSEIFFKENFIFWIIKILTEV